MTEHLEKHSLTSLTALQTQISKPPTVSIFPNHSRTLPYFLFVLICLSIGAATIENALHPLVLIILPVLFAALLRPDYSRSYGLSERAWSIVLLIVTVAFIFAFTSVRGRISLPLFFVYFTFSILVVRLFCPLTDRHVSQVILLTIGLILVNCALTNDIVFGLVLPIYLFVLMGTLLLFNVTKSEMLLGSMPVLAQTGSLWSQWYGRLALYTLLLLPLVVLLFVFVPRPFIVLPGLSAPMVHGGGIAMLEQRISYQDMVNMQNRQRIAFMIKLDKGNLPNNPYWRGLALEKNDGRSWYSDHKIKPMVKIVKFKESEELKYQFIPYRLQSKTIYIWGMPLRVTGRSKRPVEITSRGEAIVDTLMVFSDSYKVSAVDKPVPISRKDLKANLDRTGITARIEELAVQWSSGASSPGDKARALSSHLKRNFRYRLDVAAPPQGVNPSEYFLFQTRAGHCEYFAGTLCLMLRSIGIPARVVEGFAGAEPTEIPDEYIIRFANAHAWVEAAIDSSGWTPLDPTPPAPAESGYSRFSRTIGDVYDRLDHLWMSRVVYFDRSDQTAIFQVLANLLRGKISAEGYKFRIDFHIAGGLVVLLALMAATIFIRRYLRIRKDLSAIYISTMKKLVRMGMLDTVHPWHEDNAGVIVARAPYSKEAVGRFMETYLSGRFGAPKYFSWENLRKASNDLLNGLRGKASN